MLSSVHIENYRNLKSVTLDPLRQVTLISGPNSIGKTAVLEALWLHHGQGNPKLLWNMNVLRGWTPSDGNPLYALAQHEGPVHITGTRQDRLHTEVFFDVRERKDMSFLREGFETQPQVEKVTSGTAGEPTSRLSGFQQEAIKYEVLAKYVVQGKTKSEIVGLVARTAGGLAILVDPRTALPSTPQGIILRPGYRGVTPEIIDRFSRLAKAGLEPQLVSALKFIEPRLERVEVLTEGGTADLWGKLQGGLHKPVSQLGDGLGKVVALYVNLFEAKDGMVAVDEIENGVHHSALPQLWRTLGSFASTFNVQVVATTHSRECIEAAWEAFADLPQSSFVLHRLYRQDDQVQSEAYEGEKLQAALETGFEVR